MEERIKFLASEFHMYKREVQEASSSLFHTAFGGGKVDKDENRVSEFWTHEYLFRMYNIICVYFETLGLTIYLKAFQEEFKPIIHSKEEATKFAMYPLYEGDSIDDLKLLLQWEKFLAPFPIFADKQKDEEKKRLHEFLESTNEILKFKGNDVYSEPDINSIILKVLSFFYTEVTQYSEGFFRHKFMHYKPDIIIKDIGVAVEYKLIRQDKDIGLKLDELIIDAKRYTHNNFNKECIAVFCLSRAVKKTKKEVRAEWKRMAFPNNWDLIIISEVNVKDKTSKFSSKRIKSLSK